MTARRLPDARFLCQSDGTTVSRIWHAGSSTLRREESIQILFDVSGGMWPSAGKSTYQSTVHPGFQASLHSMAIAMRYHLVPG